MDAIMTVFTFSTPDKRPMDENDVKRLKEYCRVRHINFSGVVIDLIHAHLKELDKKNG